MTGFKCALISCDLEEPGFASELWPFFREYQLLAQAVLSATLEGRRLQQKFGSRYAEFQKIILDIEYTLQELKTNTKAKILIEVMTPIPILFQL
jgi:hypothetical protein